MASSVEILVTEEGEEHIIRRGAVVRISSAKGVLIVENIKYQARIYHTMIWRNNVLVAEIIDIVTAHKGLKRHYPKIMQYCEQTIKQTGAYPYFDKIVVQVRKTDKNTIFSIICYKQQYFYEVAKNITSRNEELEDETIVKDTMQQYMY